ncbi:MAG: hypothetical protein RLY14_870 [Planctomycetota bacterium]|jgi:Flp pilus assembly protein protease CpaA
MFFFSRSDFAEPLVITCLVGILGFIAWKDLQSRRIPNYATYSLVLAGCVWGFLCQTFSLTTVHIQSLSEAIFGAATCFAVMFAIYIYTNSGAGDVKLAAGIGSFFGVQEGLQTICYAYITAACFAGCLIIWFLGFGFASRRFLQILWIPVSAEDPEVERKASQLMSKGLPLAPFFLIGTLLTIAHSISLFSWN